MEGVIFQGCLEYGKKKKGEVMSNGKKKLKRETLLEVKTNLQD